MKNLGGEDTPAIGWAMGMERLNSLLPEIQSKKQDFYIVSNNMVEAMKLAQELRSQGVSVEFDLANKKFNKQIEKAAKVARFAIFLGEDEIANGNVSVKNLATAEQKTMNKEDLVNIIKE